MRRRVAALREASDAFCILVGCGLGSWAVAFVNACFWGRC
jgi:hypothetical protein